MRWVEKKRVEKGEKWENWLYIRCNVYVYDIQTNVITSVITGDGDLKISVVEWMMREQLQAEGEGFGLTLIFNYLRYLQDARSNDLTITTT